MIIEVYAFADSDGNPVEFTTRDYREAESYARQNGLALIARQYEYTDSEMIADYRPKRPRRKRA